MKWMFLKIYKGVGGWVGGLGFSQRVRQRVPRGCISFQPVLHNCIMYLTMHLNVGKLNQMEVSENI